MLIVKLSSLIIAMSTTSDNMRTGIGSVNEEVIKSNPIIQPQNIEQDNTPNETKLGLFVE